MNSCIQPARSQDIVWHLVKDLKDVRLTEWDQKMMENCQGIDWNKEFFLGRKKNLNLCKVDNVMYSLQCTV